MSLRENSQPKNSISMLDGVRAIACLIVVAFHIALMSRSLGLWNVHTIGPITSTLIMTGYSGVTLFFVLSGFLLFLPYAKAILYAQEWPSLQRFFKRRILRIWPGYYFALGILILWQQRDYLRPEHGKDLLYFLTFMMDAPTAYQRINGPFWTLAVEWQFYMLLPFLCLAFRWLVLRGSLSSRFWKLLLCIGGFIAWGIFWRHLGQYLNANPSLTFLVPRVWLNRALIVLFGTLGKYQEDFGIGMLVSTVYVLAEDHSLQGGLKRLCDVLRKWSYQLWGTGILVLFFVVWWYAVWRQEHTGWVIIDNFFVHLLSLFSWSSEFFLSLGYGLCLLSLLLGPAQLRSFFELAPVRWIGLLSYSIYIWHLPILIVFMHGVVEQLRDWHPLARYGLLWFFFICVVVPCSYLVYRLIELPWMRLGQKQRDKVVSREEVKQAL